MNLYRALIFNSGTAIAGAIIGLLLVFFILSSRFCYDHMTSQPLFVHAISSELRAGHHFSLSVERVFLFIPVIKFLVKLNSLKNDFLSLKLTFIYINSKR